MNAEFQQIHLIVERLNSAADNCPASPNLPRHGSQPQVLAIPTALSQLRFRDGHPPTLTGAKSRHPSSAFLFEPVACQQNLRLLLACTGKGQARVNGLPAPRVVVLKEKDCVQLDDDVVFHVAIFHRPCIGPVPAGWIGRECPVCRVPFAETAVAYRCPCGAALHCEPDEVDNALQCARLRAGAGCPACRRRVVLKEGYSCLPVVPDE